MTTIRQQDFIQSVADALQFISYYHPQDYIEALGDAYHAEESPAAKDAIAQILTNSRMCAEGHRPICQDTGIVVAFVKVGMDVRWERRHHVAGRTWSTRACASPTWTRTTACAHRSSPTRPAPAKNTRDNTPAVIHFDLVPGDTVEVKIAAKGGGSENKSKFVMLNPSDSIVDWVLKTLPTMGAGWCPPGMLGIGIGGTAEKAMVLAKEALMEPIDMHDLLKRGPANMIEELRIELYEKCNALGIGAQGLGGLSTVLDVKILDYPTHAASKPVGMIPNCAATRHAHFTLDGCGAAKLDAARSLAVARCALDAVAVGAARQPRHADARGSRRWKPGDTLLLNGKMLTGRDAAHKRIADISRAGEPLPAGVDFTNRVIYYVGPVDPVRDEVVGPAGPTTATRMDKFTDMMLAKTGLHRHDRQGGARPGRDRGDRKARGGVSHGRRRRCLPRVQGDQASRVVAFGDLGMEAIYEFEVKDMPVTVAVDARGTSVHRTGPREWQARIGKIPVAVE